MTITKKENEFRKKLSFEIYDSRIIDPLKKLALNEWQQFENILTSENFTILADTLNNDQTYHSLLDISTSFVCKFDDEIIGMAFLVNRGNPTTLFDANWSYIRFLTVDIHFGGKGIAQQLTKLCIEYAKQNNEKVIALHTSEFMDKARHIYEKAGFTIFRELEPRLGKKYWLYTLNL